MPATRLWVLRRKRDALLARVSSSCTCTAPCGNWGLLTQLAIWAGTRKPGVIGGVDLLHSTAISQLLVSQTHSTAISQIRFAAPRKIRCVHKQAPRRPLKAWLSAAQQETCLWVQLQEAWQALDGRHLQAAPAVLRSLETGLR